MYSHSLVNRRLLPRPSMASNPYPGLVIRLNFKEPFVLYPQAASESAPPCGRLQSIDKSSEGNIVIYKRP